MTVLPLYEYPHPILAQKAETVLKVDDEIRKLLDAYNSKKQIKVKGM